MRIAGAAERVVRVDFRHCLSLELTNFESGIAAWRARCTCHWRSSVKTTDVAAAARTALAHDATGFVWGVGDRGELIDLLDDDPA
ncbi:MAG: hypothetical protein ACJ72N_22005 [Labedaea sp.]